MAYKILGHSVTILTLLMGRHTGRTATPRTESRLRYVSRLYPAYIAGPRMACLIALLLICDTFALDRKERFKEEGRPMRKVEIRIQ